METESKSDSDRAMELRATWMRAMGVSEVEIVEFCNPEMHPADLAEETANLSAQERSAEWSISPTRWRELVSKS